MTLDGERLRIRQQIEILRGLLHGLESTIADSLPSSASAQSVADAAVRIVSTAARHDVHLRMEQP